MGCIRSLSLNTMASSCSYDATLGEGSASRFGRSGMDHSASSPIDSGPRADRFLASNVQGWSPVTSPAVPGKTIGYPADRRSTMAGERFERGGLLQRGPTCLGQNATGAGLNHTGHSCAVTDSRKRCLRLGCGNSRTCSTCNPADCCKVCMGRSSVMILIAPRSRATWRTASGSGNAGST